MRKNRPVGLSSFRRALRTEILEQRRLLAFDFGDAPDTSVGSSHGNYRTLASDNGPSHDITSSSTTLYLGAGVDSEANALSGVKANGDDTLGIPDDENGVIDPASDFFLTLGTAPSVRLRATNLASSPATLSGWIDYNGDGSFDNSTERAQLTVPAGSSNQLFVMQFPAMDAAAVAGSTYARFRLSTDAAAQNSFGPASDGEVEDYPVTIVQPSNGGVDTSKTVMLASGINGLPGMPNDERYGNAVTPLGDVDGDGVTDIAVGAFTDDTGGTDRGAVFVQFMNSDGTIKAVTKIASGLNGGSGIGTGDLYGWALASVGDLDGDGIDELAVGAYGNDTGPNAAGATHILFLNSNGTARNSVRLASQENGMPALQHDDYFGSAVTGIGDIDGDSVPDIAVGARGHTQLASYDGAVFVLLMNRDGTVKGSTKVSNGLNGGPSLSSNEEFGWALTSLGDINHDGTTELAVGCRGADGYTGAVYVLSLTSTGTVSQYVRIHNGTPGAPTLNVGDGFGFSVANFGDIDGNGINDLLVGSAGDDSSGPDRGAVFLLRLNSTGLPIGYTKVTQGVNGGPALGNSDYFGWSVASLGDIDADGEREIAVGTRSDYGGLDRGAVYLLHLHSDYFTDFGDAPDNSAGSSHSNYRTLASDNGPSHSIALSATTLYLGAGVDGESLARAGAGANGDDAFGFPDDENGVIDPSADLLLTLGTTPKVRLRATNLTGSTATLSGWIDYNGDGSFDNSAERAQLTVPAGTNNQLFVMQFPAMDAAAVAGSTYARFRLSTDAAAQNSFGPASDGEVEDYPVTIMRPSTGNVNRFESARVASGLNGGPTLNVSDQYGISVARIGDLDGDGISEVAVGAFLDDTGGLNVGAVYIEFMNPDGSIRQYKKIASGQNGAPTLGLDGFGWSLSSIGDLDGDGVDDLVVGAYQEDYGDIGTGGIRILFLNRDGTVKNSSHISNGLGGGPSLPRFANFGSAVANIGDLDGDGVQDLAVSAGAENDGGIYRGAVYVLFMNRAGTAKNFVRIANGSNGGPLLQDIDQFGSFGIASLGDLDHDGVTDIAVGARGVNNYQGGFFTLFLNSNGTVKHSVKITSASNGAPALNLSDTFGRSLSALGDVDGDGVDDLAVSSYTSNVGTGYRRGEMYIMRMKTDGTVKSYQRINSFTSGPSVGDYEQFGTSMTSVGDVNGDGVLDLLVGARGFNSYRGSTFFLPLLGASDTDFGDAPDTSVGTSHGNYQSSEPDNGPSHNIALSSKTLYLGSGVDGELNSFQNIYASGDDTTNSPNDENGIIDPSNDLLLTLGSTPKVRMRATNLTNSPATLSGWIDYNGDGAFDNVTERAQLTVPAGTNNQLFVMQFPTMNAAAVAGSTYARFRLSTDSAAQSSVGPANDGEVEDYPVSIIQPSNGNIDSAVTVKLASGMNGVPNLPNDERYGTSITSLGDLDGDGVADIAVGAFTDDTGGRDRGAIFVQFMNSDGTVKSYTKVASGLNGGVGINNDDLFGWSLASIGDLDGDGIRELAVGAYQHDTGATGAGAVHILFLNRDGTARSSIRLASGENGMRALSQYDNFGASLAALGDIDGDGVPDIAVGAVSHTETSAYNGAVFILSMNADGSVRTSKLISSGLYGLPNLAASTEFGFSLASLGDINHDGITDIAVGARGYDGYHGALFILTLDSSGSVTSNTIISSNLNGGPATLPADCFAASVAAVGDIDGNGVVDLIVGATGTDLLPNLTDVGAAYLLLMNSNGTVKNSIKYPPTLGTSVATNDYFGWSVASLGDLNHDGRIDLAVGTRDDTGGVDRGSVYLFQLSSPPNTAPQLVPITSQTANEQSLFSLTVTATDADVPAQSLTYSIDTASQTLGMSINPITGLLTWTPGASNAGQTYSVTVTATDNGTNPANLSDSKTFTIHVDSKPVALPTYYLEKQVSTSGAQTQQMLDHADFNGDGLLDIVVTNYETNSVSVYIQNSIGSYQSINIPNLSYGPTPVRAADLDHDGDIDIVVGTVNVPGYPSTGTVVVIKNQFAQTGVTNGPGLFGIPTSYPANGGTYDLEVRDIDGDGDPDVVTANHLSSVGSRVYANDGTGNLVFLGDLPGNDTRGVAVADLDGNGQPEFAFANSGSQSIYIVYNSSYFNQSFATGGNAMDIVARDFDGDGDLDLATPNRFNHSWSINWNDGAGNFSQRTDYTSIAENNYYIESEDLDGDGDFDILMTSGNGLASFINLGNGQFVEGATYPVYSATIGHFDRSDTLSFVGANANILNQFDSEFIPGIGKLVHVPYGQQNSTVNVSNWFYDREDGRNLSITVSGNDRADLASASIIGNLITITRTGSLSGTAQVRVRATDSRGQFIERLITAVIDPQPNVAPIIAPIGNKSVNEQSLLSFSVTASDADQPAQTLTNGIDSASTLLGMTINPSTGLFTWTPNETQGGQTYSVTVSVSDGLLTTTQTFQIVVDEVNSAPILAAICNLSVDALATIGFTASATDQDIPTQTITYSLDTASVSRGMTINPQTGVFSWTPSVGQAGQTFTVTVFATDNGTNPTALSDSKTLAILVNPLGPTERVVEVNQRGQTIQGGPGNQDKVRVVLSLTESLDDTVEAAFNSYRQHLAAGRYNIPFSLTPLNLTLVGFESFDRLIDFGSSRLSFDNRIKGTNSSEQLTGTSASDLIYGNGGNDIIFGAAGDDIIVGASGDDTIDGGDGNDSYLYYGVSNGFDTLQPSPGFDRVIATSGTVIGINGYSNGVEQFLGAGDTIVRDTNSSRTLDFSNTLLSGVSEIDAAGGNDIVTASNLSPGVYRGGAGDDTLNAGNQLVTWKYSGSANGYDVLNNGTGQTRAVAETAGTVIGINGYLNGVDEIVGFGDTLVQDTNSSRTLDFSNTLLTGITEIDAAGGNDIVTASNLSIGVYRGGTGDDTLNAGTQSVVWKYSGTSNGYDTLNNGVGLTRAVAETAGTTIGINGFINGVDEIAGFGDTLVQDTNSSRTLDFGNTLFTGVSEVDAAGGNDIVTASNLSAGVYRGGAGDDILNAGSQSVVWKYSGAANGYDTLNNGVGLTRAVAETAGTTIGINGYLNGVDEFTGLGDTLIQDTNSSRTLDFSSTLLTGVTEIDAAGGNDIVTASNLSPGVYRGGTGDDTLNAGTQSVVWRYSGTTNGYDTLNNGPGLTRAIAETSGTTIGINGYVNGVDEFVGFAGTLILDTNSSRTLDFSSTILTAISEIDAAGGNDIVTASNLSPGVYRGGSGDDTLNAGSQSVVWKYSGTASGYDTLNNGSGLTRAVAEAAGTTIGVNGYINGVDEFLGVGDTLIQDTNSSRTLDFSNTILTAISSIDAAGGNDIIIASALSFGSYRLGLGNDLFVVPASTAVISASILDFDDLGIDRIDLRSINTVHSRSDLTTSASQADVLVANPKFNLRLIDTALAALADEDFWFA